MAKRGEQAARVVCAGWWILLMVLPASAQFQRPHLALQLHEGYAELSVRGELGSVYALEWRRDFSPTNAWRLLNFFPMSGYPSVVQDRTLTPGEARRFYRVVSPVLPAPMVYISPGSFMMGSPDDEADRFADEGPQTWVTISRGFLIGRCEVRQVEYRSVTSNNPSLFTDLNRPVEQVSWYDAVSYCQLLTAREWAAGHIPTNWGFRLPTEAEWEYACRAGTTNRFSFGDDLSYTNLPAYAWFFDNAGTQTERGGLKAANPWGLHDVYGNVWEWCQDWAGAYPGGSVTDPQGPSSGTARVRRGGSWASYGSYCRSAARGAMDPSLWYANVGFRIVLAPVPP